MRGSFWSSRRRRSGAGVRRPNLACRERAPEAAQRGEDDRALRGREVAEDRPEPFATVGLGLGQRSKAGRRRLDEDEATVVGDARTLDEPMLLHAIDDPRRVRERDPDELGQPAHRHRAVVLEQPQDVELAHAHMALDELAHGVAAQLADPAVDFCQDGFDRRGPGLRAGARPGRSLADTSHGMKHSSEVNDFVNLNDLPTT